ncbi:MAG TPA: DUF4160 domain-containing protein [Gemmatimonadales bacterium]|jgi:hypothetical protein|nr:DUF4160 domain-containing protein [Gemmatimonadales bacterium]
MTTLRGMSPTVLRINGYRFFFFSREELRPHVHAAHSSGEAKVWLEPAVVIALSHGLSPRQLAEVVRLVQEHRDEIRHAWDAHFGR